MVHISPKAAELAKLEPFTSNPRCSVERPAWWPNSSAAAPPPGRDTPETWEHSLEVQLPLLERSLHAFSIVPAIFGQSVDTRKAADRLAALLDSQTIIVVSTDLSHYHPYDEAKTLDGRTVRAICNLNPSELTDNSACGYVPVLTLIEIAAAKALAGPAAGLSQ